MTNEQTEYLVVVSPGANDRMSEHFEFLAQVSVKAANKVLQDLIKDIRSLKNMPYRNPTYNRPYIQAGKYRYMVSNKRYHIVYQITDFTVFVDDIRDCRENDDKSILYQV
ncbi:MAG: type II toxin-antitoxin system RelE/ParE family toxin [Clostridiales bacterium]|nr:type II toxin-antitoxin system RelE/ParE family toxin [Clostridiales bacterium]